MNWHACGGRSDDAELEALPRYGGLDLGSTRDLTSFCLFWPDTGDVRCGKWRPGEDLDEAELRDKVPYQLWHKARHLELAGKRATDRRAIALRFAELKARYIIRSIGFDRWGMAELQNILDEFGIALPLKPFGQGFKDMAAAVSELERLILSRHLKHGENPLLSWALASAAARKFSKRRATGRIDPLVTLTRAIGLAAREPSPVFDFSAACVLTV